MLHPSYGELIEKVNEVNEERGLEPLNSRYSIVIAAARRARDIVDGSKCMVETDGPERNALSKVVDEMKAGKLGVYAEGSDEDDKIIAYDNMAVVDFSRDMEEEE